MTAAATASALTGLPPLPPLPPTWRRDLFWIVLVFITARALVVTTFVYRGQPFVFSDTANYLSLARHILETGTYTTDPTLGARHFPGVPLLLAFFASATSELIWTATALNITLGVAAAVLFYRNFPERRLGVLHALLLPAWVATTSTLLSESAQWAFCLLALLTLRRHPPSIARDALLLLSGFAIACRPTAVLILLPFWWLDGRRSFTRLARTALAFALLPFAVALWVCATTGIWFPENAAQTAAFTEWNAQLGGGFPDRTLALPGHAFVTGLRHPRIAPEIKLLNLLHLAVAGLAVAFACRAARARPADVLARLIAFELTINLLFILCIGGAFGHTLFYRFLATQTNPFLLYALWRGLRVPFPVWAVAGAGSVALAALSSRRA